ncbi:MAG: carbonic anhydrase, partial [Proteobacteria bacterium]
MKKIFENNRKWVKANLEADPEYFRKLVATQKPEYLYIGCADS